MADEHDLIFETSVPIPFTVADGTGIEKGSLLKMTDPKTAIITSAANDCVAGILAEEKIASDGITEAPVYRAGIFKGTASGSITVGDALQTELPANHLKTITNMSGANIVGYSLETATTGQTFFYELKPSKSNVGWT